MMIDTSEGQILTTISSAQIIRNLNNTYLIERANKLPYCKRNILLTMIIYWDKVYAEIVDLLVREIEEPHRKWNVNLDCLEYLKTRNLSNPIFADFFFNFHEPLTIAFLKKVERELSNGMPYIKKFDFIAREMSELLNIASIELEGLNISCETFGGEPLCPSFISSEISDCDDVDNIFFVMMTEEYQIETGLFEEILDVAIGYLSLSVEKIIMIVDYKNMKSNDYEFGPNARARYEKCMKVVEQVYFYHCEGHAKFAKENCDLCKFIIPNKKGLDSVVSSWKDNQELIVFEDNKCSILK